MKEELRTVVSPGVGTEVGSEGGRTDTLGEGEIEKSRGKTKTE